MDYEQKYNEALEKARKLYNDAKANEYESDMEDYESIFPELAESEDERIRKALIWHLKAGEDFVSNGVTKAECLAYLEKQKEQKPVPLLPPFDDLIPEDKMNHPLYLEGFDIGREVQKVFDEQKPAEWSEEDEDNLCRVIRVLEDNDSDWKELSNWLKSLRPQPKKGYSDEDEDRISDVLWCIEQSRKVAKNENDMGTCWFAERFVKSLRPQQRQEWSEEEKEILDSILSHYVLIDKPIDANGIPKEKYISLIKSIRFDTYKNCNSHWKPSEEQMEALHRCVDYLHGEGSGYFDPINSLYEQLKKL